jgi:hypothetical protein
MGKKYQQNREKKFQEKISLSFTRDAEWYKRTKEKIESVKTDLDRKFYTEEKRGQKIDFIHKMQKKIKDYKDALKFEEKYKKVRFFERRKLERKKERLQKEILKEDTVEKRRELDAVLNDIKYVKFYPLSYKYYSLFPKNDADNKEMIEKRDKMRKKIMLFVSIFIKKVEEKRK